MRNSMHTQYQACLGLCARSLFINYLLLALLCFKIVLYNDIFFFSFEFLGAQYGLRYPGKITMGVFKEIGFKAPLCVLCAPMSIRHYKV